MNCSKGRRVTERRTRKIKGGATEVIKEDEEGVVWKMSISE